MKVIDNVKASVLQFKNASAETRYKSLRKVNSIFASLLRYVVLIAIGYIILYPLF